MKFSSFKNNISSQNTALVCVIAGSVMISFSSVFVELVHVGPTVSGFYRVFIGGIILLVVSLLRKEALWNGRMSCLLAVAAGIFFAADLFFWHRSILFVGPGLATLLGNFQVFFLTLAGVLFMKEHIGWRLIIAIPLALVGLYLIVGIDWAQAGANFKAGVWLGLITAVAYGSYLLVLQYAQRRPGGLTIVPNMAIISFVAAFLLGGMVLINGQESFAIPDIQSWASLIALGMVSQVAGWLLISKGLSGLPTSIAGLVLLVGPALAFVWDVLFFNRPTTVIEVIGACITLGAIYLGTVGGENENK